MLTREQIQKVLKRQQAKANHRAKSKIRREQKGFTVKVNPDKLKPTF